MDEARPPPPLLDLERFLPYCLSILAARVSRAIARLYATRFRLTIPEWRVIALLARYGPITAGEIVERSQMDKVRVSRAVARLAAAGRLVRRTDPADRRRTMLHLAASGRALYGEIAPLALAVEARLLARLAPAERADLDRLLRKLEDAAATDFADAPSPHAGEGAGPSRRDGRSRGQDRRGG